MKKREISNNNKLKIVLVFFFENSFVHEYTWLIVCIYLFVCFFKKMDRTYLSLGITLEFEIHCTATALEVRTIHSPL